MPTSVIAGALLTGLATAGTASALGAGTALTIAAGLGGAALGGLQADEAAEGPEYGIKQPPKSYKEALEQEYKRARGNIKREGELARSEALQGLVSSGLSGSTVPYAATARITEGVQRQLASLYSEYTQALYQSSQPIIRRSGRSSGLLEALGSLAGMGAMHPELFTGLGGLFGGGGGGAGATTSIVPSGVASGVSGPWA